MKKNFVLVLTGIILLVGMHSCVPTPQIDSDSSDSGGGEETWVTVQLDIATWNILDFSRAGAYDAAAELVSTEGLELIVFQEIQPEDKAQLVAALAAQNISLPYTATARPGSGDDYIMAFSSIPIGGAEEIIGSTAYDPVTGQTTSLSNHRPVLKFYLEPAREIKVWFYVCHLDSGPASSDQIRRRAQASELRKAILASHNPSVDYIVILGDMNTMGDGINRDGGLIGPSDFTNNNLDYDMTGAAPDWVKTVGTMGHLCLKADQDTDNDCIPLNYTLLPGQRTNQYKPETHLSILDHIIVSPSLKLKTPDSSVKVLETWQSCSDHYPVICTFEFEIQEE